MPGKDSTHWEKEVKLAYSDVAPEFDAAMAELRIPIDHSLPGLPQNTSLAERTNQEAINTVATSLRHAGTPAQYWPFALNCVTQSQRRGCGRGW